MVSPQTVANHLSHLAAVFAVARPAWGYPLDQTAMKDAFVVAKRLGIASKSRERDRRPTLDELDKVMEHFGERLKRRPSSIPMQKVMGFAIFSTRRLEEITRILWKDLDVEGRKPRFSAGYEKSRRKDRQRRMVRTPLRGYADRPLNA